MYCHTVAAIALCALQIPLIFSTASVMIPATIIAAFMFGAFWAPTAPFYSEEFGEKHFGQNWGILMLSPAASGFAFQALSGLVYSAHVVPGSVECYGPECYQLAFVVCAVVLAGAIALSIVLLRRSRIPAWAQQLRHYNDTESMLGGAAERPVEEEEGVSGAVQDADL